MTLKTWKSELLGITIDIDHDDCTGCGDCAVVCLSEVIEIVDGKSICLVIDNCTECCACVEECPEKAIVHSSCMDCRKID